MKQIFFFALGSLFFFNSCRKEKDGIGKLNIEIAHQIDGQDLKFNTMNYQCEAGYPYQITRLEYYLSAFRFTDKQGHVYTSDKVAYMNPNKESTLNFVFDDIPSGDYVQMDFLIGLDSAHNISNSLDATVENQNMAWPDMMGGGYHFMKLEGIFQDNNNNTGFAMHLGRNGFVTPIHLKKSFSVKRNRTSSLLLNMNINEWFRNPETYNFITDGAYSMGDNAAMGKLIRNGVDVFN